jgi:hypothetical protein
MKKALPHDWIRSGRISSACLCGFLALSPCSAQTEGEAIPQPYPTDRYEPIWKKSPFTLSSTAPEAVAGFAENLALAGVVKINGESYVAVINKATQKRELISSKPNPQGIFLAKLESGEEMDKVAVTLQKGDEISVMRYDTAFLKAFAPKPAGPGQNPGTGASPATAGQNSSTTSPNQVPPPSPRVRHSRMIPSQPAAPSATGAPKQPARPPSSKP